MILVTKKIIFSLLENISKSRRVISARRVLLNTNKWKQFLFKTFILNSKNVISTGKLLDDTGNIDKWLFLLSGK